MEPTATLSPCETANLTAIRDWLVCARAWPSALGHLGCPGSLHTVRKLHWLRAAYRAGAFEDDAHAEKLSPQEHVRRRAQRFLDSLWQGEHLP